MIGDSFSTEVLEYIRDNFGDRKQTISEEILEKFGVHIDYMFIRKIAVYRFGLRTSRSPVYSHEGAEEFIREYYPYMPCDEFARKFNEEFGTNYCQGTLQARANRSGIFNKDEYSEEEERWLIENSTSYRMTDLRKEFNDRFPRERSMSSIKGKCSALGIKINTKEKSQVLRTASLNRFHENIGDKWEVGEVRKLQNIEYIKVDDPEKGPYITLRGRYEYERQTGKKLKKGDVMLFLDGDNTNYSLSNMKPVSRYVAYKMSCCTGPLKERDREVNRAYMMAYQIDEIGRKNEYR